MFSPLDAEESVDDVQALYNAMHAWRTLREQLQPEGIAPKALLVDGKIPIPRTTVKDAYKL